MSKINLELTKKDILRLSAFLEEEINFFDKEDNAEEMKECESLLRQITTPPKTTTENRDDFIFWSLPQDDSIRVSISFWNFEQDLYEAIDDYEPLPLLKKIEFFFKNNSDNEKEVFEWLKNHTQELQEEADNE